MTDTVPDVTPEPDVNVIPGPLVDSISTIPPEIMLWTQFVEDGEVFIMDRSTVIAGPYTIDDMEDLRSQYTVLVSTVAGVNPYRVANLVTKYRLTILPDTFRFVGKQLDI